MAKIAFVCNVISDKSHSGETRQFFAGCGEKLFQSLIDPLLVLFRENHNTINETDSIFQEGSFASELHNFRHSADGREPMGIFLFDLRKYSSGIQTIDLDSNSSMDHVSWSPYNADMWHIPGDRPKKRDIPKFCILKCDNLNSLIDLLAGIPVELDP